MTAVLTQQERMANAARISQNLRWEAARATVKAKGQGLAVEVRSLVEYVWGNRPRPPFDAESLAADGALLDELGNAFAQLEEALQQANDDLCAEIATNALRIEKAQKQAERQEGQAA